MVKEKLMLKLGKKSSLLGGKGGSGFDDLDKIASELGTSKTSLLNSDAVKNIRIEKVKIKHGSLVDSIQFFYKVETNSKTYSIEGNKHGGNGGKESTVNLENGEWILNISGRHGRLIDQLSFSTYIPSKKQIKTYGPYGGSGGNPFNLPALCCIFGRSGCNLDAFGIYEAKVSSNYEKESKRWETESQEFASLLFPNQPYNFDQLKQEITRLKYQELAPQVRKDKEQFKQLITTAKEKAGESFASIVDLLLEDHQQKEQTTEVSQKDKLNGKIEAYQNILATNLTKEEIQILLNKQTKLHQLEKHLVSLQQSQQTAHIQQTCPPKQ